MIALARGKSKELTAAMAEADRDASGALHFAPFDLGAIDKIPELVRGLRKEFGPLYGLVNNAAIGHAGALATMHNSKLEEQVRVNTLSPLVLTKYVVRSMMADGAGRIVNVASIIGFTGYSGLAVMPRQDLDDRHDSLARARGRPLRRQCQRGGAGVSRHRHDAWLRPRDAAEDHARAPRFAASPRSRTSPPQSSFCSSDKARNITGTVMTVDAGATA